MEDIRLKRAGVRLAGALVRRARRYHDRLFGPDAYQEQIDASVSQVEHLNLNGLVVAISGSSRGIGYVIAKALSASGAHVVINGRDDSRVKRSAQRLCDDGGSALAVCADVSTADGAHQFIAQAVAKFGRVDVLINNAAVAGPVHTKPWDIDPSEWEPVLGSNLGGPFFCAREAMQWMVANKVAGRIVNVSSGAGRAAAPGMAPYVASKFGLEGLMRALALDAHGTGIVVCALQLGTLRTDMSKSLVRFEEHEHLPPPETVLPLFMHAITGPAEQLAGRSLASWRFQQDPEAEAALARPLSSFAKFSFKPPECNGKKVDRSAPGMLALDRAENPLGMPRAVRDLLMQRGDSFDFSHYPSGDGYACLRASLSARLGLPAEDFSFAPGSSELVERIVRTFAGCGDDVVSNEPSWFMFDRFCAMAEVAPVKVPVRRREPDGPFDHNLEAVAKAITSRTRLVYLINPSNPMGNGIARREFLDFLSEVPRHIPVVVDEAYIEFSQNPHLLRTNEVVPETDRMLIGLRTFSKFYGLAGLRIGYAFGVPRAMRLLSRLEQLFCVSSVAEEAALAALGDEGHARATHALLTTEKARIRARLAEAGLACVPSEAHFMLVECPAPASQADSVWSAFIDAGILIPRGLIFDRYMMLPIVKPEQNDRHLQILVCEAMRYRDPVTGVA